MRTYDELNKTEKGRAFDKALDDLIRAVTEGAVRFNDKLNRDDLQARIDNAWKKAEAMQTPWFAREYIMDAAGDDLRSMARADCEDALYPDPTERVIRL